MATIPADLIPALQGIIPSGLATADADGMPNVTYISQVFQVDDEHVATSRQFFNKTGRNLQANPRACTVLINPADGSYWRLDLRHLRTETEGDLFDEMEMQLEAIASMQSMEDTFVLAAADVYHVEGVAKLT